MALNIQNRQRIRAVNLRHLRRAVTTLLRDLLGIAQYDISICFVNEEEISRLNVSFHRHKGSTDVITFDYSERDGHAGNFLHGEIFVCVDEAVAQAKRFRTTWQAEMARYIIHGLLHLLGFDDENPVQRKKMKREEDRLLERLRQQCDLAKL